MLTDLIIFCEVLTEMYNLKNFGKLSWISDAYAGGDEWFKQIYKEIVDAAEETPELDAPACSAHVANDIHFWVSKLDVSPFEEGYDIEQLAERIWSEVGEEGLAGICAEDLADISDFDEEETDCLDQMARDDGWYNEGEDEWDEPADVRKHNAEGEQHHMSTMEGIREQEEFEFEKNPNSVPLVDRTNEELCEFYGMEE